MASLPNFQFSTQEDWYWELVFQTPQGDPIDLSARTFEVDVALGNNDAALLTLTSGNGGLVLKTETTNVLVHRVSKATAAAWKQALYTVDVLEIVDGERRRFMPARVTFGTPVSFQASNAYQQQVTYSASSVAVVSPISLPGPQGLAPAHRWVDADGTPDPSGTYLQFQNPDGTWASATQLLGGIGPFASPTAAANGVETDTSMSPALTADAIVAQAIVKSSPLYMDDAYLVVPDGTTMVIVRTAFTAQRSLVLPTAARDPNQPLVIIVRPGTASATFPVAVKPTSGELFLDKIATDASPYTITGVGKTTLHADGVNLWTV